MFLSHINCGSYDYIEAPKQGPDVFCKLKMLLLDNGKVAFQADNGKYLSRISFSNDPVDSNNFIMPSKASIDVFSQCQYEYNPMCC